MVPTCDLVSRFRLHHESALFMSIFMHNNVIQRSFMFKIIIDQVPVLYLFLVSGAPIFVSLHHLLFILASVVLSDTI